MNLDRIINESVKRCLMEAKVNSVPKKSRASFKRELEKVFKLGEKEFGHEATGFLVREYLDSWYNSNDKQYSDNELSSVRSHMTNYYGPEGEYEE